MSTAHKAALAKGREEGLVVRRYLEAIESSRPKRGRKRTPASIDRKIESIDNQMSGVDPLARLHLIQQRKDLLEEKTRTSETVDLSSLESGFVKVAKAYGDRKGISYSTWRAAGVGASVLQKAGISRGRA